MLMSWGYVRYRPWIVNMHTDTEIGCSAKDAISYKEKKKTCCGLGKDGVK